MKNYPVMWGWKTTQLRGDHNKPLQGSQSSNQYNLRGSMYGIFTYIYHPNQLNAGNIFILVTWILCAMKCNGKKGCFLFFRGACCVSAFSFLISKRTIRSKNSPTAWATKTQETRIRRTRSKPWCQRLGKWQQQRINIKKHHTTTKTTTSSSSSSPSWWSSSSSIHQTLV